MSDLLLSKASNSSHQDSSEQSEMFSLEFQFVVRRVVPTSIQAEESKESRAAESSTTSLDQILAPVFLVQEEHSAGFLESQWLRIVRWRE